MVNPPEVLSVAQARTRALRMRAVLTDCDGVLTDGGIYYDKSGEALMRFDRRDGMGVARLREAGIATCIVTREASEIVRRRGEKLGVRVWGGVADKAAQLSHILAEMGIEPEAAAYIGDDVNDLDVMKLLFSAGLTASPQDGFSSVKAAAHFVTHAPGGHGAFREFVEWILTLRGDLP